MKHPIYILVLILGMSFLVGCQKQSEETEKSSILSKEEAAFAELREVAALYQDIYLNAYQNNSLGTLEVKQEIANCLGKAGYIVSDIENQMNMINSSEAETFCHELEQGKTAEIEIYLIMDNGGLVKYDLRAINDTVEVVKSSLSWEGTEMKTNYYEEFTSSDWNYTEKGYLFLEQSHEIAFDGAPGQVGIRVKSLEQTLRELTETYVSPIGYERNNLFITEWTEEDYGELDFYDLYDSIYPLIFGNSVPYEGGSLSQEFMIPQNDFEKVIQTYFKIDSSALQEKTTYDSESQSYCYHSRGLYDAEMPYGPYPEVVDFETQEDGTLKLIIEAVWIKAKNDCAFVSELVIRPLKNGGFQYVSNHVISTEDTIEPAWYRPRLTNEEWINYQRELE